MNLVNYGGEFFKRLPWMYNCVQKVGIATNLKRGVGTCISVIA
ncbi:hypothetical protein [Clostridium sp. Marseille-QA1073]